MIKKIISEKLEHSHCQTIHIVNNREFVNLLIYFNQLKATLYGYCTV